MITDIQLSFWGGYSQHKWIWNGILMILAMTMLLNVSDYLESFKKINHKKTLILFFFSITFSLFITGLVNVALNGIIHNVFAFYYFFSCPLGIFLIAHFNSKNLLRKDWIIHIIFSLAILFLPLSLLHVFKGMGIPEAIHSSLILSWNLWLLTKIN